jgi:hypothetical protein
MATSTTTRTRRDGGGQESTGWPRNLGLEATRDAQEALGRSMRASVESMSTFSEVGQRVNRELFALTVASTKEALRFWADMQGSALDALQTGFGAWSTGQPILQSWQRLLDGSARAFGRFAETMQGTTEEGTERIKEAVDAMADQVKESSAQLGGLADDIEERRARTADSGASSARSSARS